MAERIVRRSSLILFMGLLVIQLPLLGVEPGTPKPLSPWNNRAIYLHTRSVLLNKGDYLERIVRRLGNQTLELECFISMEGDIKTLAPIVKNFENYKNWVFNNFNQDPNGGTYLFQVHNARTLPQSPSILVADLVFDVPLFYRKVTRQFKLEYLKQDQFVTVKAKIIGMNNPLVSNAEGFLKFFPAENDPKRLWVYGRGLSRLSSKILYETFPDRMLSNMAKERLQIMTDNYQEQESRFRNKERILASSPSPEVISNQTPTEKKETGDSP